MVPGEIIKNGFTEGKLWLTHLIAFCDQDLFLDTGRAFHDIYLDFSQVFSTVLHNIHVSKLGYYCFDGQTTIRLKTHSLGSEG